MRLDKVITLLDIVQEDNENGFPQEVIKNRKPVFANRLSVHSSEFYRASQAGYLLNQVFEIRTKEYQKQKHIEFDSDRYEIVRTFIKGEFIELICKSYQASPVGK